MTAVSPKLPSSVSHIRHDQSHLLAQILTNPPIASPLTPFCLSAFIRIKSRSPTSTSCRNWSRRSRSGRKSGDALLDSVRFTTSPAAALSRRLPRASRVLAPPAGDALLDRVRPTARLFCMSLVLRASIFLHIRSTHSVLPHMAIWGLSGSYAHPAVILAPVPAPCAAPKGLC